MIGDEVMFVVDGVADAARIGLGLADAYADDDLLSDVRVGLSVGPVLLKDGDYFGPTVNLAHRITNIGNPGTRDHVRQVPAWPWSEEAPDEFTARPLRPRQLKDLGRVQLWWCGRPGTEADGVGCRSRPPPQRALGAAGRGPARARRAARTSVSACWPGRAPEDSAGAEPGGGDTEGP